MLSHIVCISAHPYWWKNLENNTIVRPSTDYNVLSETSRQLDSNSQIESNEAKDEWWKAFDTSNSSDVNEDNIERGKLSTLEINFIKSFHINHNFIRCT